MSSNDDSSENSEQRAITDRNIDAYFPKPIDYMEPTILTQKGFKPITKIEEENLLKRGIMTYYRGHLDSSCCEICDNALWESDKYARRKGKFNPVEIQKYKYIDKRKINCEKYKDERKGSLNIQTGYRVFIEEDEKKIAAINEENDKNEYFVGILNNFAAILKPIVESSEEAHNIMNVGNLIRVIQDNDLINLFFHSSPDLQAEKYNFFAYISNVNEMMRFKFFSNLGYVRSADTYSTIVSIILVMLEEFTLREGVSYHFLTFLESVQQKNFSLNFKKMVRQLGQLPHQKEIKKRIPKVQFDNLDSNEFKRNKSFYKKRKIMDTCPDEVTGRKILDVIYGEYGE